MGFKFLKTARDSVNELVSTTGSRLLTELANLALGNVTVALPTIQAQVCASTIAFTHVDDMHAHVGALHGGICCSFPVCAR